MLIGFLIRSEEDWKEWKASVSSLPGPPFIYIAEAKQRRRSELGDKPMVESEGGVSGGMSQEVTVDTDDDDYGVISFR